MVEVDTSWIRKERDWPCSGRASSPDYGGSSATTTWLCVSSSSSCSASSSPSPTASLVDPTWPTRPSLDPSPRLHCPFSPSHSFPHSLVHPQPDLIPFIFPLRSPDNVVLDKSLSLRVAAAYGVRRYCRRLEEPFNLPVRVTSASLLPRTHCPPQDHHRPLRPPRRR